MNNNQSDLQVWWQNRAHIRNILQAAGHELIVMQRSHHDLERSEKKDHTLVSEADEASHYQIKSGLNQLASGNNLESLCLLSEEELPENPSTMHATLFDAKNQGGFVLDPLDGTLAFLDGEPGYSINLAYLQAGALKLAWLYFPAIGLLYEIDKTGSISRYVSQDSKFILTERENAVELLRKLIISEQAFNAKGVSCKVAVSRYHKSHISLYEKLINYYHQLAGVQFDQAEPVVADASVKFALVAEREVLCYPRLASLSLWDVAPGFLLAKCSGCVLLDWRQQPYQLDADDNWKVPPFFLSSMT